MKQRKNKDELSAEEFLRINKLYNQFIVQKNKRDKLLGSILTGLLNYKIEEEKQREKIFTNKNQSCWSVYVKVEPNGKITYTDCPYTWTY